ncbi:hypothetical protein BJX66DRAFT_320702, partial [Aspergillus keveii]
APWPSTTPPALPILRSLTGSFGCPAPRLTAACSRPPAGAWPSAPLVLVLFETPPGGPAGPAPLILSVRPPNHLVEGECMYIHHPPPMAMRACSLPMRRVQRVVRLCPSRNNREVNIGPGFSGFDRTSNFRITPTRISPRILVAKYTRVN